MGVGDWPIWWGRSSVLCYDMSWPHYGLIIWGGVWACLAFLFGVGAYCSDKLGQISTLYHMEFLHLHASILDLGSVMIMNDNPLYINR